MKWGKATGIGGAIGGIAFLGILFFLGSPGASDSLLPLTYVPTKICMWLADVCFGGGEGGMIFIFPAWFLCGAVIGDIVGAVIAGFSRL
jgi:hypothetical protein